MTLPCKLITFALLLQDAHAVARLCTMFFFCCAVPSFAIARDEKMRRFARGKILRGMGVRGFRTGGHRVAPSP